MPLNMCTLSFLLAFPLHLTKPQSYYLSGIFSIPSQCFASTVACPTPSPSSPLNSKLRGAPAPSYLWVNLPPNGRLPLLLIFVGRRQCIQMALCPTHRQWKKPWRNLPVLWWWAPCVSSWGQAPGLLCFLKCQPNKSALNDSNRQWGCHCSPRSVAQTQCMSCQALPCCILPLKVSTMSTRTYTFRELEALQVNNI